MVKIINQLINLFNQNFAHLLGIIAYGIIVLALSIVGYRSFRAIIPFRGGEGLTERENIAVGIIIAGIVIGISIIVAVTSYEPAPIVVTVPASLSGGCGATGGGCGSSRGQKQSPFISLPPNTTHSKAKALSAPEKTAQASPSPQFSPPGERR